MGAFEIVFWILTSLVLIGGASVVLFTNPIYSAFSLVTTMIGMAGLFVMLDAHFLAAVQLVVYAGAVMVLFVMVLMLFDLKNEVKAFSPGKFSGFIKIAASGLLCGMIAGAVAMTTNPGFGAPQTPTDGAETKDIAMLLFTKYLFVFEAMGVLLLIIAIAAVVLARSKGGTHGQA